MIVLHGGILMWCSCITALIVQNLVDNIYNKFAIFYGLAVVMLSVIIILFLLTLIYSVSRFILSVPPVRPIAKVLTILFGIIVLFFRFFFSRIHSVICLNSGDRNCFRSNTRMDSFWTAINAYLEYFKGIKWDFSQNGEIDKMGTLLGPENDRIRRFFFPGGSRRCRYCGSVMHQNDMTRKLIIAFDANRDNNRGWKEFILHNPVPVEQDGQWDVSEIRIDPKTASRALMEKLVTHLVNNPPVWGLRKVKVVCAGSLDELGVPIANLLRRNFKDIVLIPPV
jgi:hypothetical protein